MVFGNKRLQGEVAYTGGVIKGTARLVKNVNDMPSLQKGDILVSSRTYQDLLPAMKRSAAIVSELGGLLSHAAIIARELHIPCVVGVRNAMSIIPNGSLVSVDTESGFVDILD
jgi:pyruvate,water dikinase